MRRRHAYVVYKELIEYGTSEFAKEFVKFVKKKHPRIYKKELEPHLKGR